jgi:hypothetical protein
MTILNYLIDNGYVFYGVFASTAGFMGYKLISSYVNQFYVDKGIQTDAWDDYSDRPSQILQTSPITDNTITPVFSPVDQIDVGTQVNFNTMELGIQTSQISSGSSSIATTVLPIPPMNVEVIPNPDITNNQILNSLQLEKIQEIKGLYSNELYSNIITDADLNYIVESFTIDQLNLSNINELILTFITLYNG